MDKKLKIAIVGSGPAGACAAIFLHKNGFDITVFEKVKKPMPIGAGFMLQPTGMNILHKMGLLQKATERATPINHLLGKNKNDKTILNLKFQDFPPLKYSLGLHRGLIFKILHQELESLNIRLIANSSIADFTQNAEEVRIFDADKNDLGSFDLLVIADGAFSKLRAKSGIAVKEHWYDWGAMWHVSKDPDFIIGNKIFQRYKTSKKLIGFMPIGLGPDEQNTTPLINFFYSLPLRKFDRYKSLSIDKWKQKALRLEPISESFIQDIKSMHDFTYTGYGRMKPLSMYKNRVAIIGDAAHGLSPQLGQGVSMAFLDAYVLSQHLSAEKNIKSALEKFSRERTAHLSYYVWADKYVAPLFQSDSTFQAFLRDFGLKNLHHLPFTYRILVETMAGIKTGFFSKNLDINYDEIYQLGNVSANANTLLP